jgi:3-keto-disaccharide hydrolase
MKSQHLDFKSLILQLLLQTLRIPPPDVQNPLQEADDKGHEIQIDEIGFDSATNTGGHPEKRTGAIYNLQAPTSFPSNPVGAWNTYVIEANGPQITVTLNGKVVNVYQSNRRTSGHIALQAHHRTSRVQFRNLHIQKLPRLPFSATPQFCRAAWRRNNPSSSVRRRTRFIATRGAGVTLYARTISRMFNRYHTVPIQAS